MAVWLSSQYRFPTGVRGAEAGVSIDTIAARAGVELRWRLLAARLGAGADFVHVTPQHGTLDASATLAPPHWTTGLVVTAAIGAATTVGSGTRIAVNLFADLAPTAVHYNLQIDGRASPVFSPSRASPGPGPRDHAALEITSNHPSDGLAGAARASGRPHRRKGGPPGADRCR